VFIAILRPGKKSIVVRRKDGPLTPTNEFKRGGGDRPFTVCSRTAAFDYKIKTKLRSLTPQPGFSGRIHKAVAWQC